MYELAICELMHPSLHGTYLDVSGNYLIIWFISYKEFISKAYEKSLKNMKKYYWSRKTSPVHPFIRAYWKILAQDKYYTLDIVDDNELDTGEQVAIIKTHWLRIFQRKWKNICKDKKIAQKKIKYLQYRTIHGKWP